MLDIGWTEIATIAIIAIIIIGPRDLPKAMRSLAKMIGKAKAMMREFQSNIDDLIKESELEEVKKQIQSARNFDIKSKISETIDPDGEIEKSMDMSKEVSDFNKSLKDDTSKSGEQPASAPDTPQIETPKADAPEADKNDKAKS